MNRAEIPKYAVIACVAVFLSFRLHELSHWLAGEILGYDMRVTMNTAYPLGVEEYEEAWHGDVISAAGPLFTILQAIAIYLLMKRRRVLALFPFLFVPLVMRLIALFAGFRNPNDEARISGNLGLTIWTLPAIVCVFLLYLVWDTSRRYELRAGFIWTMLVFVLAFSTLVILVIG